jgi:integrase
MRMFADTGMRLGEMAGLRLDDLDPDVDQVAYVTGKGPTSAHARSATRRSRRSIGISACAPGTTAPTIRSCGCPRCPA